MKKTIKRTKKTSVARRIHRHIKLAVVPHSANQFRPHLARTYSIVMLLAIVSITFVGSRLSTNDSVLGVEANVSATELLTDTNAERGRDNLQPLKYNDRLSTAAFLKAQDMFKQQYWAHVAPDGTTPWQWFSKVSYNYTYAGENLAKNFKTASATTTAWMASQKHRENILNPHYTDIGFAVVDGELGGKRTTLIVALYGEPATEEQVAGAAIPQGHSITPVAAAMSPITRFGVILQSMSPATLASVMLLLFTAMIAMSAHTYRRQLPVPIRRSWRYHHGLYKAVGLTAVVVVIVGLYSGGQI